MPQKTISILGCGWLGEPLADLLIRSGYTVKGSTTTPEKLPGLKERGIKPYLFHLGSEEAGNQAGDFFESDILFLNIPPGRRDPEVKERFTSTMRRGIELIHRGGTPFVMFASSTSVYPELNRVVFEEDAGAAESPSGQALFDAERALQSDLSFATTIVRFAGLYGYDRRPGRFMAGRQHVPGGNTPVNLIHRDDSIQIVLRLIERDVRGEVFNACSDKHPTRREFYTWAARRQGFEPPEFLEEGDVPYKIVSSEKLKRKLDYTFLYPDPMQEAP